MANIKFSLVMAIADRGEDIFRDYRTAMISPSAVRGAAVRVLATGGGTGVMAEAFVGERPVLERSELSEKAVSPLDPEDELIPAEPGRPFERVSMSLDNQSGAQRTVNIKLMIREL